MTECTDIIEANNEIDKLKRENKKLNALCVEYGFEVGRLEEENEQLKRKMEKVYDSLVDENEQLKKELYDCKKDEKQLGISFMEFKMQLIEVLQQNYTYAYNQRQKNLDKSIVARNYEVLYQTIDNIAETMNVNIERFPKGDVE